jgi:antitoxin FitA
MPTIIVRNLPEETHRALKARAAAHRRSAEAEVREILDQAVRPPERLRIGSELAALGRKFGGVRLKVRRDATATSTAEFD